MNRFLLIAFVVSFTVAANGQTPGQPIVQGQVGNDAISASDVRIDGSTFQMRGLVMTLGGRQLRADEASLNMDTLQIELRGNVTLTLPKVEGIGFYKLLPR
jgi:hypothetical protein